MNFLDWLIWVSPQVFIAVCVGLCFAVIFHGMQGGYD